MLAELTFAVALLAALIIPRFVGGFLLHQLLFMVVGAASVYTGFLPFFAGVAVALAPTLVLLALVGYYYWLGRRALSGKLGDGQKWIAEFARDDDKEFLEAMEQIDRRDVKEIIVIADSKQELKELAQERAAERDS